MNRSRLGPCNTVDHINPALSIVRNTVAYGHKGNAGFIPSAVVEFVSFQTNWFCAVPIY